MPEISNVMLQIFSSDLFYKVYPFWSFCLCSVAKLDQTDMIRMYREKNINELKIQYKT